MGRAWRPPPKLPLRSVTLHRGPPPEKVVAAAAVAAEEHGGGDSG